MALKKDEVVEIVNIASSVVALIRIIAGIFGGKVEIKKSRPESKH